MTAHILFKTEVQRCSKISKTNVIYHFFSKSNKYSSSFKVYIINHTSHILYGTQYCIITLQKHKGLPTYAKIAGAHDL